VSSLVQIIIYLIRFHSFSSGGEKGEGKDLKPERSRKVSKWRGKNFGLAVGK
jgi:hypothetical protein